MPGQYQLTMHHLPMPLTHFCCAISVEAWDAWIRWRGHHEVRDLTIDSTWQRVADAIASSEGAMARIWSRRFFEAFSLLQLLPEIVLLRDCGRNSPLSLQAVPSAVLNIAAFVVTRQHGPPHLDQDRLSAVAVLAVRLLDNVLASDTTKTNGQKGLRVGVIGLADALHLLGLSYDSDEARQKSAEIAAILAEGCLRGSIELARERGPADFDMCAMRATWLARETAPELIAEAHRHGVRHVHMTELTAQPRLALLANNVGDILDPGMGPGLLKHHALLWGLQLNALHTVIPLSPASTPGQNPTTTPRSLTIENVSMKARIALRAAVQPWFDAPIDVPLLVAEEPQADLAVEILNLTRFHGLPAAKWQTVYPRDSDRT